MNQFNKTHFSLFFAIGVTMMLCSSLGKASGNPELHNSPHAEAETLSKLINLPFPPTQVIWQVTEMTSHQQDSFGPKDWMLFTLLTFEKTHFQTILEQSPKQPQSVFWNAENVFEWFPPALKEKLALESGNYRWRVSTREAKLFAKSPLLNGYLVPLEDHFQIFLFLYTR